MNYWKPNSNLRVVLMKRYFIVLLLFALGSCTAVRVVTHSPSSDATKAPAGLYEVDPDHQSLIFSVGHLGFSRFIGRFDHWTAQLDFNPQEPDGSALMVEIDAASLSTSSQTMTDLVQGTDMLDIETYPKIHFKIEDIQLTGETSGDATGILTMAGQSHPVHLNIEFNGGGRNPLSPYYTLGFTAKGVLNRRDFGLNAWPIVVTNEVEFEINVEFRQPLS